LLIGTVAALALARLVKTQLHGVTPWDPGTFGGVAVVPAAAAMLATYLPAQKATRTDPILALRSENQPLFWLCASIEA
jgi:putative ABC transport system permease protein